MREPFLNTDMCYHYYQLKIKLRCEKQYLIKKSF